MEYVDLATAQTMPGLRLVLTRNVPGPWSEAAKAVFALRNVEFVPVAQRGGEENDDLVTWTRHRNAPIAMYNDESPRVRWLEIVELAERLGSGPHLLPTDIRERMAVVGLVNEIAGESGFAWYGRMLMLKPAHDAKGDDVLRTPMYRDYYSAEKAANAADNVHDVLNLLSSVIRAQQEKGSHYLVGNTFSAADLYWAYFSQLLNALPDDVNPMPKFLRNAWGLVATAIGEYDPALIEQRNHSFEAHLTLPLDF